MPEARLPGGYMKREGKPSTEATLIARLIDRPIRPLFPKQFFNEVQVVVTTIAADPDYSMDTLGIIGASAALSISSIPFAEPCGGLRIVYTKEGKFIPNPKISETDEALLDIVVAGTRQGITMVEGGAKEVSEEVLLEALTISQEYINEQIALVEELVAEIKPVKVEIVPPAPVMLPEELDRIVEEARPRMIAANNDKDKLRRAENVSNLKKEVMAKYEIDKEHEAYKEVFNALEDLEVETVRSQILEENVRADGRNNKQIRDITIEIDLFDTLHGSALFTRGQTQSLGVVTLGSRNEVQYIDTIEMGETVKSNFMLHYNFPPFSVGEVKRMTSVSRREIGHGHLAERAITPLLPEVGTFPYTIRVVSEILESNGSSSMATVCSSSLSLMSAGVPLKKACAGIAMGLVWDKEKGKHRVLSDIQGLEDHFGDIDFKVAGTREGITAFQMDVKTVGITKEIMKECLEQAKEGRYYILDKMDAVITAPREKVSDFAPKVKALRIPEDTIGLVIGSGGKVIKKIMAITESDIDIEDDGSVIVYNQDASRLEETASIIDHIVNGLKKDEIVIGEVTRIEEYGVFLESVPGQTVMLHRSQMKDRAPVRDRFKMGDKVKVQVTGRDEKNRDKVIEI